MLVASRLRNGLGLLVPLTLACSVYLYFYPFFRQCAFPLPSRNATEAFEGTKKLHWPFADEESLRSIPTKQAPFRLLALGDPQLEGDTSIPLAYAGFMPHIPQLLKQLTFQTYHQSLKERIRWSMHDLVDIFFDDIPNIFESARKLFDLFGNDFYLAHIYRTLHWWTQPSHVTVLGDLLGSQWIDDNEFERRGRRFWNRTFKGGERVPDDVAVFPAQEYNLTGFLNGSPEEDIWKKRIINVAGNHDIGYAGDLTEERLERFERHFGKANYELRFELPVTDPEYNATIINEETNPDSKRLAPELRIVVLNDMNLDTPAKSVPLQDATYHFINSVIGTSAAVEFAGHFTLILTHIPMYKPAGICVDAPFFDFHSQDDGGGLKEQYLLSGDASKGLLEGIFGINADTNAAGNGVGRKGLVMNGHDHEGCDTYHFINQTNGTNSFDRSWETVLWRDAMMGYPARLGLQGRREITVRSMMGDFGGNAGLLSMWFNFETWEWEHEYLDCPLGSQHFWWLTHFLIFGTIACIISYMAVILMGAVGVDVDSYYAIAEKWTRNQVIALCAKAMAKFRGKTKQDDRTQTQEEKSKSKSSQ
ncbi:hypothetical protein NQ176_g2810 [Zarea fungicola]|uniref:Uncharacterized protein n=1 Tax=Zarea fungicola TaxID=93591 RepID=A0ACC1NMR9_9HYPO|nr:hypothetical protein NQ176_g2810 [Lecanicillium fungicola]